MTLCLCCTNFFNEKSNFCRHGNTTGVGSSSAGAVEIGAEYGVLLFGRFDLKEELFILRCQKKIWMGTIMLFPCQIKISWHFSVSSGKTVLCYFSKWRLLLFHFFIRNHHAFRNFIPKLKYRADWLSMWHVCGAGEVHTVWGGGRPAGKRPLGRPRRRWEDKMDIQEVGQEALEWNDLARDRGKWRALVNVVMKLRVPWNAGIYWLTEDLLASQEVLCSMELVTKVVSQSVSHTTEHCHSVFLKTLHIMLSICHLFPFSALF